MNIQNVRHGGGMYFFFRSFLVVVTIYIAILITPYTPWGEGVPAHRISSIGLIIIFVVMITSYLLGRWTKSGKILYLRSEMQRCENLIKAYSYPDTYSREMQEGFLQRKRDVKSFLEDLMSRKGRIKE